MSIPLIALLAVVVVVIGLWKIPWGDVFSLKGGFSDLDHVQILAPDIVEPGKAFRVNLVGMDSAGRPINGYQRSPSTRLRIEGASGTIQPVPQGSGFQVVIHKVAADSQLRLIVSDGTAFGEANLQWSIAPVELSLATTQLYSGRCTALSLYATDQYANREIYTPTTAVRLQAQDAELAWRIRDDRLELCPAKVATPYSATVSIYDARFQGEGRLSILSAVDMDFAGAEGFDLFDALLLSRSIGVSAGTLRRNPDVALRGLPISAPVQQVIGKLLVSIRKHSKLLDVSGDNALTALDGELLKRHIRHRSKLQSGAAGVASYQRELMRGLSPQQVSLQTVEVRLQQLSMALADPEALHTATRITP